MFAGYGSVRGGRQLLQMHAQRGGMVLVHFVRVRRRMDVPWFVVLAVVGGRDVGWTGDW